MTSFKPALVLLVAFLGAACSDNEAPPAEDHTPTTYSILVNDQAVTAPYTFTAGQMVRVRLKFFNKDREDLDDVEDSHYGGLTFEPGSRATVVRVADRNYQFDVTGAAAGTGTLVVGYGHELAADEHTFPSEAVTVLPDEGAQ